ncbi:hypothetical protein EMIT0357P_30240 [Pseudomonas marginalis]
MPSRTGCLQRPHLGVSPRRSAGMRLRPLQWGQGITRGSDMVGSVDVANAPYLESGISFIKLGGDDACANRFANVDWRMPI